MLAGRIAIFVLASAAIGCGASQPQRVDKVRALALRTPGPKQAIKLANVVWKGWLKHRYDEDPAGLQRDTDDTLAILADTIPRAGADASTLVAWRARMLLAAGDPDASEAEYVRSHELGPNPIASYTLIELYGGRADSDNVGRLCRETLAGIAERERHVTLKRCKRAMNASSEEAALAWMTPEQHIWLAEEHAAEEEQRRIDDRIAAETRQCTATCEQRALYCENRCYDGDVPCMQNCERIGQSCDSACWAEAETRR